MKKLKITLACNGGVSTKILTGKIIEAAKKREYDIECDAYSAAAIDDFIEGTDVLLLGPQVKYMAESMRKKFPGIPVDVIDMRDYGSMNGEKILSNVIEKYNL
ncbi:PTS sugar transporter subunit IIB [Paenibacillus sp. DMB5]|uniref:PTS sugar transporter subunit IIB n=1 Tax=Paenibacillus sp. DMB5 TaxID=1780103 RepID=UPI00076DA4B9|nr:PTS sugar transporter subunit IIB [Paenibacillus sp. DMB5]KUP25912.1 hypothetical protein AWJ19_33385 [Paenibacillus sp. DMB5]